MERRTIPDGLEVSFIDLGGQRVALLSYPVRVNELADALTPAERAIVALAVRGLSNGEIATRRGTSARTVANQIAAIFRKTGVTSRRELVARARGPSKSGRA